MLTDRQLRHLSSKFNTLIDRVSRASKADPTIAYDMLAKVIVDAKAIRHSLKHEKKKEGS
jgi:hypothetical protein